MLNQNMNKYYEDLQTEKKNTGEWKLIIYTILNKMYIKKMQNK